MTRVRPSMLVACLSVLWALAHAPAVIAQEYDEDDYHAFDHDEEHFGYAPRPEDARRDAANLLSKDFEHAKIVAVRDDKLVVLELKTENATDLYETENAMGEEWHSRPYFSPDGKEVAMSVEEDGYLWNVETAKRRAIRSDEPVYEPQFWTDPKTGDRCIIYADTADHLMWPEDKAKGATYRLWEKSGRVEKLWDFPCDGGLSADGRYLADAVGGAVIFDLKRKAAQVLHRGDVACNLSTAPDSSHRVMHLYWPHVQFGMKNPFDREVWKIRVPEPAEEWDNPRFSNHPDFATAIAIVNSERYIALVRVSTKQVVILSQFGTGWAVPQLYVPSGRFAAKHPRTPISHLKLQRLGYFNQLLVESDDYGMLLAELKKIDDPEARQVTKAITGWVARSMKQAEHGPDPDQSDAILQELSSKFPNHKIGDRARDLMDSEAFRSDRMATRKLRELVELSNRLVVLPDGEADYYDQTFRQRNQVVLNEMIALARDLSEQWPETEAAVRSSEIATHFGLPTESEYDHDERLVLSATVVEVSTVPTAAQIAPYRECVVFVKYRIDSISEGTYLPRQIVIAHWGMRDGKHTDAAAWKPGMKQQISCDLFDEHDELQNVHWADEASEVELTPFWALEVKPAG